MRFVSKYRRYRITAREHVKMTLANGKENVIQHGVICNFEHGGLLGWEKEKAKGIFKFRGATQEADEVTPVDPGGRLSLYDTDAAHLVNEWASWDEREGSKPGTIKQEVEQFLLGYSSRGRDYLLLEPDPLAPPWPAYDKHRPSGTRTAEKTAEKQLQVALEVGVPIEQLIDYERQRFGDERMLARYQQALTFTPEEELVEA